MRKPPEPSEPLDSAFCRNRHLRSPHLCLTRQREGECRLLETEGGRGLCMPKFVRTVVAQLDSQPQRGAAQWPRSRFLRAARAATACPWKVQQHEGRRPVLPKTGRRELRRQQLQLRRQLFGICSHGSNDGKFAGVCPLRKGTRLASRMIPSLDFPT